MSFFRIGIHADRDELPGMIRNPDEQFSIIDVPQIGDIVYGWAPENRAIVAVGVVQDVIGERALVAWLWPADARAKTRPGLAYDTWCQELNSDRQRDIIHLLTQDS